MEQGNGIKEVARTSDKKEKEITELDLQKEIAAIYEKHKIKGIYIINGSNQTVYSFAGIGPGLALDFCQEFKVKVMALIENGHKNETRV